MGLVLSNPDMNDQRIRHSRHLMFNLSRPEMSLILLAPLDRQAGGYGLCRSQPAAIARGPSNDDTVSDQVEGDSVFASTSDSDYRRILRLCQRGKRHLETIKRFDMPGFRPTDSYLREMIRFDVLGAGEAEGDIDVYAIDEEYWQSHWWSQSTAK